MINGLRVASLNLFSGRVLGPTGPRAAPDGALAAAVASLDADVLGLQEVDVAQPRSRGEDQCALAVAALGGVGAFAATVAGTPGEGGWSAAATTLDVAGEAGPDGRGAATGPRFGVALLTQRPVERWARLELGRVPGRFPLPVPVPGARPRIVWLREEPRVVLAARLRDPELTVAVTHLSFVAGANLRQLVRARAWLAARFPPPYLLLGDLNLPPALAGGQSFAPLVRAATYPGPRPRLQLDHVLGRELGPWEVAAAGAQNAGIGDHLAVTVDLRR